VVADQGAAGKVLFSGQPGQEEGEGESQRPMSGHAVASSPPPHYPRPGEKDKAGDTKY
jgi:hypothetical protein